ncbi:unnamed protein product, partial [Staurois parvus]
VCCVPRTQQITDHGKSQRCRLGHVISCVQSQLITWDIYTDHQGTECPDDRCNPSSATCQCPSVPCASAHQCLMLVPISATYQCLPVRINAAYQCPSELPFSVTHQCCQSVPPISAASQCHLSVPCISAA